MSKYSLPRKINLRGLRQMSQKLLVVSSVAALLFSLMPLTSNAQLTVDQLLAAQSGGTTSTSYPSITVTSSSNTSLLLKVTPLSFNGTNWTYQITWHRTLATNGSLYVTLKSDKTQKVFTADPAGQNDNGSQTMILAPSSSYRAEFFQQPGAGGVLLLRKFFTTLSASAGSTTTTTGTSQSSASGASVAAQLAANPNG